ncbi:MAG: hypothetical protein LBR83_09530, partial [Clostridiales bacterium]|nr:hypothetical protein [Clostridiales bacterium]
MTLGELATALSRAMGYTELTENTYLDLPEGHLHEEGILMLAAMGLLPEDGYLNPDIPVTRMKFFEIIAKAFGIAPERGQTSFKDNASIRNVNKRFVKALETLGLISGDTADIRGALTYGAFLEVFDKFFGPPVVSPGEHTGVIDGNLMVNGEGISLAGMTINGDLFISAADGSIDLTGVTVTGTIHIVGTSEVNLTDVNAAGMVLTSPGLSVSASGDTRLGVVSVKRDVAISSTVPGGAPIADKLEITRDVENVSIALEGVNITALDNKSKGVAMTGNAHFDTSANSSRFSKDSTVVIGGNRVASAPSSSSSSSSTVSAPPNSGSSSGSGSSTPSYGGGETKPPVVPQTPNEKKLIVYFNNWSGQRVSDLPWDRLSAINHAFWKIDPSGDGKYPIVPSGNTQEQNDAFFAEYETYMAEYPNVDVFISVGGWNDTKWFAEMASTEAGMQSFIDSCVEALDKYPFIGGIDIDWEYPGVSRNGEGVGFQGGPADRANFTALMKGMREAFDAAGHADKLISFCAPSSVNNIYNGRAEYDYAAVAPYVDRINIMTYDMSGSWSPGAYHQAGLYPGPYMEGEGVSASEVAEHLIGLGVDPGKINIGSPLYSHGWSVPSSVTEGTDAQIAAGALGQQKTENVSDKQWYDLRALELTEGWVTGYDSVSGAAYLYNVNPSSPSYQSFHSYESYRSIQAKTNYINSMNLGGIIVWDTAGDSENFAMISRMAKGLGIWDGELPEYNPDPVIEKGPYVGFWNATRTWNPGDFAIYEGKVWKCIVTAADGQYPGANWGFWAGPAWNNEQAIGIEKDLLTIPKLTIPAWSAEEDYPLGAVVRYEGDLYKCIADNAASDGVNPADTDYWEAYDPTTAEAPVIPQANPVGKWNASYSYKQGDVVIHNYKVWKFVPSAAGGIG